MKKVSKVSILGVGWLGFPLAKHLMNQDFQVKGSTTTPPKMSLLKEANLEPFLLRLNPEPEGKGWPYFLMSDVLIINIPPRVRKKQQSIHFHPQQITHLIERLTNYPHLKLIYISSTSVYPNVEREVNENEPLTQMNEAGKSILKAEELLKNFADARLCILRCGGLMGYDRVPGKYFQGKKGLTSGQIPVNFVHQDDVVQIIHQVIVQQAWGKTYNIVAPKHPIRKEIYLKNAQEFGFEPPEFIEKPPQAYKIVNGDKLSEELRYTYKYPDPLSFRYNQKKTNDEY